MGLKQWKVKSRFAEQGIVSYGAPSTKDRLRSFGNKAWNVTKNAAISVNATRERIVKSEGYKKFNTWADGASDNFFSNIEGKKTKKKR